MWQIILMVLKGFAEAMGFLRNKQQMDAGAANARADNAEEALDAITKANAARDEARKGNAAAPPSDDASGLPDDGFRRD